MSRWAPSGMSYSFGPGPMTPAVRMLIYANVGLWVITLMLPDLVIAAFGLTPREVVTEGRVWEVATYLFVHEPRAIGHILFNMLYVWMFGVDLERRWGTPAFVRYYFITGVGAGLCVVGASLLPFDATQPTWNAVTIGASGAVYGLLLAWALVFPNRPILFMLIFPMSARTFAIIMGAIAFFAATSPRGDAVSHTAHLGGLVIGWLYLKGPRNLRLELQYRLAKWRMDRMRRRLSVHRGGRDRVH